MFVTWCVLCPGLGPAGECGPVDQPDGGPVQVQRAAGRPRDSLGPAEGRHLQVRCKIQNNTVSMYSMQNSAAASRPALAL